MKTRYRIKPVDRGTIRYCLQFLHEETVVRPWWWPFGPRERVVATWRYVPSRRLSAPTRAGCCIPDGSLGEDIHLVENGYHFERHKLAALAGAHPDIAAYFASLREEAEAWCREKAEERAEAKVIYLDEGVS